MAAVANGTVVDLDRPLENGTAATGPIELRILTSKDREALDVLRHSTAHIMARAIMRLFPGVRLAFGPTTASGFYYDVEIDGRSLSEDDFPAIEAEMAQHPQGRGAVRAVLAAGGRGPPVRRRPGPDPQGRAYRRRAA